jgi:hypothetical protein
VDVLADARLPDFAAVLLDHAGRILVISESDELCVPEMIGVGHFPSYRPLYMRAR